MKSKLKLIVGGFMFVLAALTGISFYFVSMVRNYEPMTLSDIVDNDSLRPDYFIHGFEDPLEYGNAYDDVAFSSEGFNLFGWYIPAKDSSSTKTIMMIHGRGANRLRPLNRFQVLKDIGADSSYNIFFPDLRNSGISDASKTDLGYNHATDIVNSMFFLNETYGQDTFMIWGQSQGGMATAISVNREDLVTRFDDAGFTLERLILECPLSTAEGSVMHDATVKMGLPAFLVNMALWTWDTVHLDGYLSEMKMSKLIPGAKVPVLVIQGEVDYWTPTHLLQQELDPMPSNATLEMFKTGGHVRIYDQPENVERYTRIVGEFLGFPVPAPTLAPTTE